MENDDKRERNNAAVKKSREKTKLEEEERKLKKENLQEDNTAIENNIEALNQELDFLSEATQALAVAGGSVKNHDLAKLQNLVKDAQDVAGQGGSGASKKEQENR